MKDNMDTNYEEFFSAYDGGEGNQTDTVEDVTEPVEDPSQDGAKPQDEPEGGEPSDDVDGGGEEEPGVEGQDGGDKPVSEQKFTIKVNKQDMELDAARMIEYAQKGVDYDRVKGQLETERQNSQTLQEQMDKQRPVMELLELAAEQNEMTVEQLLDHVQVSMLMGKGLTEREAQEKIRADKAERQVKLLTEKKSDPKPQEQPTDDGAARAQRDIEEFNRNFPDVQLTEDMINKLVPDIQKGMSLSAAYRKYDKAQDAARIEELERKLAARDQNKKNRAKTPGSQRDSGGQRTRTAEDDFFAAFEK